MRRKNSIKQIFNNQNSLVQEPARIKGAFKQFFYGLFNSSKPTKAAIEKCLKDLYPKVSNEMNEKLCQIFTRVEVDEAIHKMAPLKS